MSQEWALERFYHTVVNVSDLDRSIAFYRTLGFEVLHDRRDVVWPDFVAKNFAMPRAQGRGALLVLGEDPDGPVVDLVEWTQPRVEKDPRPEPIPQILAFRTRNVAAAYAALSEQGIPFTNELIGPSPDLGLLGVCCCQDPDGTIVELIEYAPGQRHSRTDSLETTS